jgi:hypothetical protein
VKNKENRNFNNLTEPPRKVYFTLKIYSIFSTQQRIFEFMKIFWIYFVLYILLSEYKKLEYDNYWKGITCIFIVIALFSILKGIKVGFQRIKYFKNGKITFAVLIRKEELRFQGINTTYEFEYSVGNEKHTLLYKAVNEGTKLIEDEKNEPIIYLVDKPDKGMLLDSIHARTYVDESGLFCLKYPILGFIYFMMDIIFGITLIIGVLWIFGLVDFVNIIANLL